MVYLGVDGGGTKTAFMLIDQEGNIRAHTKKGTCHYIQVGFDNFQKVIAEGIAEVCQSANVNFEDIDYSFLGIPTYGEFEDDIPRVNRVIADIFDSNNFKCGNDVEAGWAGSLACQPGINIVGGTGAIGFGRDQDGNSDRVSGWGYFCGDEGSAYWLGKQLISIFTKEADGRLEKTPLYDIVREEFKLNRDLDLITVIYEKLERKRDKIAQLAKLVYKAAEKRDQKAIDLYKQAAYEFSLMVNALIKRLNFDEKKKILLSYSGGVFKAGSFILKPLEEYIEQDNVKLLQPLLQPVTGAALYALLLDRQLNDDSHDKIIQNIQNEEKRLEI